MTYNLSKLLFLQEISHFYSFKQPLVEGSKLELTLT